jgi:hypothetical protein
MRRRKRQFSNYLSNETEKASTIAIIPPMFFSVDAEERKQTSGLESKALTRGSSDSVIQIGREELRK